MSLASQIFDYLAQSIGGLYLMAIILRFFLQLARADFYNPISQAVVKATNPVLIPLRRDVPGIFGIAIASIVLALLIHLIIGEINFFIALQYFYNPISALTFGVLGILKLTIYLGYAIGIVVVISSFVAPYSSHPAILLARQLLDPLCGPIQRLIPPMGGLDFSVFFVFLGIGVLNMILESFAYQLHIPTTGLTLLVIGF